MPKELTIIPGLFCGADDQEEEKFYEFPSFDKNVEIRVRESDLLRCSGLRIRDEFERLGIIHKGNFGTVYKVADKFNNEIYALKKFHLVTDMKRGFPPSVLQEISVLNILQHENIVNAHGIIVGDQLESNLLLLDYCVISLHDMMERVPEIFKRDVVKYIMRQLFEGLSSIHEGRVIHRNISCRNLLFTENGILKISGFRTARFYDPDSIAPTVETELIYCAPEVLYNIHYGMLADIWSAGCVFAYLMLKKPLFNGNTVNDLLKSMYTVLGTPCEKIWPGFDELVLKKGTPHEKKFDKEHPYSQIGKIFAKVPKPNSQLLRILLKYYPQARLDAKEIIEKSDYILKTAPECAAEDMCVMIQKGLSTPFRK